MAHVGRRNEAIGTKEKPLPIIDLFPNELRKALPPLNSQEGISDPVVCVKFLSRDSNWVWYVTEGSAQDDDFLFFGFVVGLEKEGGTSHARN